MFYHANLKHQKCVSSVTTFNTIYMGGDCSTPTNSHYIQNDTKKLSKSDREILAFVDDPDSNGTILIAFGHMVKWNSAPKSLIDAFLASIKDLRDYRIIWQFDGSMPDSKFDHVKVSPWIPQVNYYVIIAVPLLFIYLFIYLFLSYCFEIPGTSSQTSKNQALHYSWRNEKCPGDNLFGNSRHHHPIFRRADPKRILDCKKRRRTDCGKT